MKTTLLIAVLLVGVFVAIGQPNHVPTRTVVPPLPPGMKEEPLPSKKSTQARLMRRAAEEMEAAARVDLAALQASILSKLNGMDLSTKNFDVKVIGASFMDNGTNLLFQVKCSYMEK